MLDEIGDPDAPAGSRSRSLWLVSEARFIRGRVQDSAKDLAFVLSRLEEERSWEVLGAPSYEALCEREIKLTAEQVAAIRKAKKGESLAAALARAGVVAVAKHGGDRRSISASQVAHEGVKPLAKHRRTMMDDQGYNITLPSQRGASAEYILRRLQRDRPDLVQKVAAGEIRSARAAAIEAGIVKVPTGLDLLLKAWTRASSEERDRFLAEIGAAFSR